MSPADHQDFQVDLRRSATPWDRRTKLRRGLWQFLVKPLYRLLPGKRNPLRIPLLRMMGARIGKGCFIQQRVDVLIPWELELGDFVAIAHDVTILNFARLRVGPMTVVSQDAHLCTGTHDYAHPRFPLVFRPIEIGAEAWIASGAFVGPGVTVGRGTVVGARAVVTKDLPDWKICAGNPCRPIKDRVINAAN